LIKHNPLAHLACWPTGPTGLLAQQNRRPTQPTWLGLTSRLGSGSTDPARPLSLVYSPLTPELAGDPDRPRRRPAVPADPGNLCRRRLDRMLASTSSTDTSSWNPRVLPLRGDLDGFPLGIRRHQSPPVRNCSQPPLLCLLRIPWCWRCAVHAGGRLPWIASSRPRGHCSAMPSGQASGRRVSSFFSFYLTLYFSPWPWSLTIWSRPMSQAHRAGSVILLMTLVIL
jgi:hypothetical protein